MILSICINIIEIYILIGLIVYILSIDNLIKECIKESSGYLNDKGKLMIIFSWPLYIQYLIWPDDVWREYKDDNGKIKRVRLTKNGLLKAKKQAIKNKDNIIAEMGFEEYNRIISTIDKELENFKN
jgi:hypothetical protein